MSWTSTPDGPAPHDAAGHPHWTLCLHLPIQPTHPLLQVRLELSSN